MEEKTRKPEAKKREANHTAENCLYGESVGTLRVSRNIHSDLKSQGTHGRKDTRTGRKRLSIQPKIFKLPTAA